MNKTISFTALQRLGTIFILFVTYQWQKRKEKKRETLVIHRVSFEFDIFFFIGICLVLLWSRAFTHYYYFKKFIKIRKFLSIYWRFQANSCIMKKKKKHFNFSFSLYELWLIVIAPMHALHVGLELITDTQSQLFLMGRNMSITFNKSEIGQDTTIFRVVALSPCYLNCLESWIKLPRFL